MSLTELLLRLCGVKIESNAHLAGARLALRNSDMLGWIVLLVGLHMNWAVLRDGTAFTGEHQF